MCMYVCAYVCMSVNVRLSVWVVNVLQLAITNKI